MGYRVECVRLRTPPDTQSDRHGTTPTTLAQVSLRGRATPVRRVWDVRGACFPGCSTWKKKPALSIERRRP